MKVDPNAPAYPHSITRQNGDGSKTVTTYHGLTARLAIAAQIAAGIVSTDSSDDPVSDNKYVARSSLALADALIAAHNEEGA